MTITLTVKARLRFEDPGCADSVSRTMEQYRLACNHVSQHIFDSGFPLNYYRLHDELYHSLRPMFGLKAQMTQSCIKTVIARYKAVRTQLARKPAKYDSGETHADGRRKYVYVPKTLEWLREPVRFSRPQLSLDRGRDYSFKKGGVLSLLTLDGRVSLKITYKGFDAYLDGAWKFGEAKVIRSGGNWFLHISVSKEADSIDSGQSEQVVGIDRGVNNIATSYDYDGKTAFFSGTQVLRKRKHYKELRSSLQSRNTKSSKRRVRSLGQKENRWMDDVNHVISKTLVGRYEPNTLFVIEDLTDVRFATEKSHKDSRYENASWAFYDLEQKLEYKAMLKGSSVKKADARYTSQRCPKCGRINADNRDHASHLYACDVCGYKSNDDRLAGMNLCELGRRHVMEGDESPGFAKHA